MGMTPEVFAKPSTCKETRSVVDVSVLLTTPSDSPHRISGTADRWHPHLLSTISFDGWQFPRPVQDVLWVGKPGLESTPARKFPRTLEWGTDLACCQLI
jgi:hypothetical protein